MQKEEFLQLIDKYLEGRANAAEERMLMNYYNSFQDSEQWDMTVLGDKEVVERNVLEKLMEALRQKQAPVRKLFNWQRVAVAAGIVGVLFVAGYWLLNNTKTTDDGQQATAVKINDVQAPDKNRAQIKLADGKVVYLDSVGNGELANANGVKVVKTEDGRIEYSGDPSTSSGGVVSGELKYNTLSNPRGSQVIAMTLADGSRVWLNAESSVTYPIAFVTNERKVTITGEAYFEITHDASKPFVVSKGETSVTVLGTHFNVNAYEDESDIKVTLLEGSVKVRTGNTNRLLKPGQQARVTNDIQIESSVDVDQVMAWKNGYFQFNRSSLQEVMRQIERWYDVEVVYESLPTAMEFGGKITRNSSASEVLKILELSKVNFRIEGKRIVVFQ